ncbi:MAG: nucleotidyltransferase family protein [Solirubrobacteraceae bacterium]
MRPSVETIRALAMEAALVEVVAAMGRRGVAPLLFKGPALARWLYDDPAERQFDDLDLLVAPDQWTAANEALADAGFTERPALTREETTTRHAATWRREGTPAVEVDLHRAPFLLADRDQAAVWRAVTAATETIDFAGVPVAVPGRAAHALIVALHAAQHGYRAPRSVEDLRRALGRVGEADWRRAAAIARDLDADARLAAGLRMLPAGAALADRLELTDRLGPRLSLHLHDGPKTWGGFDRLAGIESRRERARAAVAIAFPSPGYLRVADPLARRGRPGLALAYLRRPLRLAVRAPAGFLAWRRVARDERDRVPGENRHPRAQDQA